MNRRKSIEESGDQYGRPNLSVALELRMYPSVVTMSGCRHAAIICTVLLSSTSSQFSRSVSLLTLSYVLARSNVAILLRSLITKVLKSIGVSGGDSFAWKPNWRPCISTTSVSFLISAVSTVYLTTRAYIPACN